MVWWLFEGGTKTDGVYYLASPWATTILIERYTVVEVQLTYSINFKKCSNADEKSYKIIQNVAFAFPARRLHARQFFIWVLRRFRRVTTITIIRASIILIESVANNAEQFRRWFNIKSTKMRQIQSSLLESKILAIKSNEIPTRNLVAKILDDTYVAFDVRERKRNDVCVWFRNCSFANLCIRGIRFEG